MSSAVAKGNRAKARTKKWLEDQGYSVAHLERMHFIWTPTRRIPTKRDQYASDLQAIRPDMPVIYIQVKLGAPNRAATIRKFREFPFPAAHSLQWLIVWARGGREPRVFDVTADVQR